MGPHLPKLLSNVKRLTFLRQYIISYQLTNLFSARKLRHKTQSEARPDKVLVVHVAVEVVCLEI